MELKGKKATVVGLGREGVALVRFLAARGAQITVSDMKTAEQLKGSLAQIEGLPVHLSLGGNRIEDTEEADIVYVSPGVPLDLPPLVAAQQRGIPISSSTVLFFQLCPAPIVGITGSSGKTTTTTLVGNIFQEAGRDVFVGGNIGLPLLDKLPEITEHSWVVLELSSFQLILMEQSPHAATITNITPNHLDMHPSMEHYIWAKTNILRYQTAQDFAVLNYDDPLMRSIAADCLSQVVFFSQTRELEPAGVFLRGGQVVIRHQGREETFLSTKDIELLGRHNIDNVLTACALATVCGIEAKPIARAVASFKGVEHRLELVMHINGVAYYNDSIATTPDRTIAGLRSFSQPVILLAGGRDKHLPMETLSEVVAERCKSVVLYGEAARSFEEALSAQPGHPEVLRSPSFAEAVNTAHRLAVAGDVVLLSPACTSFDLFTDFEERGSEFKRLVASLEDVK